MPAVLAESAELEAFIERCLAELPGNYREAVVLRDAEGLSNGRAATVLELDFGQLQKRPSPWPDERHASLDAGS